MSAPILVVDDSLTVRMDIGDALEAAGFRAVLCGDLKTARQEIARLAPAVVVLDVQLPDGDGLELVRELRAGNGGRIPVLLLSSQAEVANRVRGLDAGADQYVGKPYDVGQVIARVRALVQAQSAREPGQRRVLVIDDSVTFRSELSEALSREGFFVHEAATGEEGLALASSLRPDAIVVDGMLPGIDGTTVVRRLKSDAALRSTPCLLLTAAEGAQDELRSLEAGADAHVRKSEDLPVILVRLAALLRGASTSEPRGPSLLAPKRVLAVDDSPTYLNELGEQLRQEGYDVVLAARGEQALELLAAQPVDCILLDLMMPGLSGVETCARIKESAAWRHIPLLMLTSREDRESMISGMNAGADDYIAKSADFDVLKARLRAQLRRTHFEEENRRQREVRVRREAEARFQRLVRSDILGVIHADLDGQLRGANDAFLKMLGYARGELESGALASEALTPGEWRESDRRAVEEVRRFGKASSFEKEFVRKDGQRLPVLLGLVRVDDEDETVGFVLDQTERKRAEQERAAYAAALESANQELEAFSYSVAHDLRAPLRSIDGFSAALLEDYESALDDVGRKYLRSIRTAAGRMAQLIDDLLTLSRVTRSELHRQPLDLCELAREAEARLRLLQPARNVELAVQLNLAAEGDPRLLAVVFDNLLGNAWKFTGKREVGHVEVGMTSVEGAPAFFVRDDGAGFDMNYVGKLFGVFQRLHHAADFDGTGIGLATVQRIIRRHGGRVWAEGEVGRGATFFFTLGEAS